MTYKIKTTTRGSLHLTDNGIIHQAHYIHTTITTKVSRSNVILCLQ